jgi:N-acetylglucosaminyldiphosphoundecaprenol N-acetyl-beta-D-mannosaminyltransferase
VDDLIMADPVAIDIFGIRVTPLTQDELIELVAGEISAHRRSVIANQNLHGAYLYFRDADFRALHTSAYVHIDGMSIVWLARLAGIRLTRAHRLAYLDMMGPLLARAAAHGWRLFYLGGAPEVLRVGLLRLREAHPGLIIEGQHGFFDQTPRSPESEAVLERINALRPNILVIGMGMPLQEHWLQANLDRLAVNCVLLAGAYLDYVAGRQSAAPRWLGPLGLEWLYRLAANPGRLWRRYLIEPWVLAWYLLRHQFSYWSRR